MIAVHKLLKKLLVTIGAFVLMVVVGALVVRFFFWEQQGLKPVTKILVSGEISENDGYYFDELKASYGGVRINGKGWLPALGSLSIFKTKQQSEEILDERNESTPQEQADAWSWLNVEASGEPVMVDLEFGPLPAMPDVISIEGTIAGRNFLWEQNPYAKVEAEFFWNGEILTTNLNILVSGGLNLTNGQANVLVAPRLRGFFGIVTLPLQPFTRIEGKGPITNITWKGLGTGK